MKHFFTCTNCNKTFKITEANYLCPDCLPLNSKNKPLLGILKVNYDFNQLFVDRYKAQKCKIFNIMPTDISKFKLKIGKTPVYEIDSNLFIKDDSQNPSFSFKDRASALVSLIAKQKNAKHIITASTGNAASSLACMAAANKQKAIIVVPKKAPKAKLVQCLVAGAKLIVVDGNYDDAFDVSIELAEKNNWYNRNTAFNPYTIEGKKTAAFEIFIDFANNMPDIIFVACGDGVITSGLYKGFEDLYKLGLISKIPTICIVQAENSANIAKNLNTDTPVFCKTHTIADSICVDIPKNFYMTKNYINTYNGMAVIVSDDEIALAQKQLASKTGIFTEPASASSFAAYNKVKPFLNQNTKVLLMLTGSGLKDIEAASRNLKIPKPKTVKQILAEY